MKILYYRNTHDENGIYRGDEYFGKSVQLYSKWKEGEITGIYPTKEDHSKWNKENEEFERQQLFFGVHTFEGNKGMTFEEIYNNTFTLLIGGAYDGEIDIHDERLSIQSHLRGLAFMIEHRLVRLELFTE